MIMLSQQMILLLESISIDYFIVMKILLLLKTCVLCCDKKDCHKTMHFERNGSYRNIIESGLIVKFSITIA